MKQKTCENNSILIIDDERTNIIALRSMLSPEYTIYATSEGCDAVEIAQREQPDVILLDILMPEMDGYEIIKTLKNSVKTCDIPVIFITGLDSSEAEEKGLALGAADYILKPFHETIVKLRIENQIKIINHVKLVVEKEIAEKSSRAKSEFLARMSHELRTPMNAIMGIVQIMNMRGIPENMKGSVNKIDMASRHLLKMVDDVLDISGMEDGRFKLSEDVFDTSVVFSDARNETERKASAKQQDLTFSFDAAIPEKLTGDGKRLKQVLCNIMDNAIKFTPEYGEISVKAGVSETCPETVTLRFEVADNGIGISDEQKGKLFGMFEQADGGSTRKYGGIGIGLPLSKRIIEKMGGTIDVESEPGKGTKVTFTCKLSTCAS